MSTRIRHLDTTSGSAGGATLIATTQAPHTGTSYIAGLVGYPSGMSYDLNYMFADHASKVGVIGDFTDVSPGGYNYNPCNHTKWEYDFPQVAFTISGASTEYKSKLCHAVTTGTGSAGAALAKRHADLYWPNWDSDSNAIARAIANMEFGPQSSGVNVPQFLGELKDFSTVYGRVAGAFSKRKPSFFREYKRLANKGMSALDMLRSLASADLFNSFAVQPLRRDISNLLRMRSHLSSQRSRLSGAEPVVVRGRVLDHGSGKVLLTNWYHNVTMSYKRERIVTAWALVQYEQGFIASIPDSILAADVLGFDQLPNAAWELVPWSFLVDYLVQVGDWLNGITNNDNVVKIPYTILQSGSSVKKISSNYVDCLFLGGETAHPYWNRVSNVSGPERATGSLIKTTYVRVSDLDFETIPVPTVGLPNFGQVRNLVDIAFLRLSG